MSESGGQENSTGQFASFLFGCRIITTLLLLAYGGLFTYGAYAYLIPGRHPVWSAVLIGSLITLLAGGVFWFLAGFLPRMLRLIVITLVFLLVLLLPVSAVVSKTVTHGEFGYTVIGWQPVPVLDVNISGSGLVWFRRKDHTFHKSEIKPYARGADVVLIGTGWNEQARVDQDLPERVTDKIVVRSSGRAIALYNKYRKQGKRVALLLHTTC